MDPVLNNEKLQKTPPEPSGENTDSKDSVQYESTAPNFELTECAEKASGGKKEDGEKNKGGGMRKFLSVVGGMKFSFVLLFLIVAACIAGSIIPQQAGETALTAEYGEFWTKVILWLRLDHVFTCWWFTFLSGLLCLNLILCSVIRLPAILKARKAGNKGIGIWGSWITHLGLLLLVVTFALSQWTAKEYVVYGVAGSTQPVEDTGYYLTIDSFETKLRDDFTVEQYEAGLTVTDPNGNEVSGLSSVNYPMEAFGYTFYQDSTGWASYVDIYNGDELTKMDLICTGEYTYPEELPGLCLMFYKFYPDFSQEGDQYISKTPLLNNPRFLYCVYYGTQLMLMDFAEPGEKIEVADFTFVMRDPVPYTLIVIKKDSMAVFVGISALILLIGLLICFYIRPAEKRKAQQAEEKRKRPEEGTEKIPDVAADQSGKAPEEIRKSEPEEDVREGLKTEPQKDAIKDEAGEKADASSNS